LRNINDNSTLKSDRVRIVSGGLSRSPSGFPKSQSKDRRRIRKENGENNFEQTGSAVGEIVVNPMSVSARQVASPHSNQANHAQE
jgi:hypothetical protein